jgi:D-sedoheptulose 7-phosphate isomerase
MKFFSNNTKYITHYLEGLISTVKDLSLKEINETIQLLVKLKRRRGRLFILGIGGSAANSSHAVNDFRKICKIEAYTPSDNISELTARTNDDGWESVFINWLKVSNLTKKDTVMVFSVGGGDSKKNISVNLIYALRYAKKVGANIIGIVSKDGGFTKKVANITIMISVKSIKTTTAYAESLQAIILHTIVNHPSLT